jgi:zinc and cadmium transporter
MNVLLYSVIATILISLISLAGVLLLGFGRKKIDKFLFFLISFSAGTLMGGAFFHLLPEGLEEMGDAISVFEIAIFGFIIFYIMERVLRWHHCHEEDCQVHKVLGYQNLFGDGVHNFLDGLIIVSAFFVDTGLGIAVTLSVALHEIPQEISDFGVLLYSGFSRSKAILFNLASALLAVVGAVVGFFLIESTETIAGFLLPLAAGGFLYIAASDMVPELHKEKNLKKSLAAFLFFVAAIIMMRLLAHSH